MNRIISANVPDILYILGKYIIKFIFKMAAILYVMVKNEEGTITKTLESAKNYFRELVIYETGSTDKTVDKIVEWTEANNVKLHMLNGEFVDFSTSRNVGLRFAEKFCKKDDFIMILDANDELVVDGDIPAELAKVPPNVNGVMVNSYWEFSADKNMMSHIKFLFIRAGKNIKYKNRVHEYLMNGDAQFDTYYFIQHVNLRQDRQDDDKKTQMRYTRDIEFLHKDLADAQALDGLEKAKTISRIYYYLGKTYMLLQNIDNAVKYLKLRSKIKEGDEEERHMVYMYLGLIFGQLANPNVQNIRDILLVKNDKKRLREKSLKHFLEAYNVMPYVEPLIYITKYYCDQSDWQTAYLHGNCSLHITIPTHSHSFNIKMYKFTRYLIMAEICFQLGKYDEGVQNIDKIDEIIHVEGNTISLPTYITKEEFEQYQKIKNAYRTHAFVSVEGNGKTKAIIFHNEVEASSEKIFLIACGGYWHKWDGNLLNSHRGIGGSELVAIKLAEYMSKQDGWRVVFCCDSEKESVINNVTYLPLHKYEAFIQSNLVETLYIYRLANMIRYHNVRNLYLSMEDVSFAGELVIKLGVMRHIICKSQWQQDIHLINQQALAPFLKVIGNGIEPARFLPDLSLDALLEQKVKNRFIYSSCPTRGLRGALDIFKQVYVFCPDATFHVFVDLEIIDYGPNTDMVQKLCEELKWTPGVVLYPKVSQQRLAEEALKAEYWLYPCTFTETYCITAQEMQAAGVITLYKPLAAMATTIGDRGYSIDSLEPDQYVTILKELMCNPNKAGEKRERVRVAREWALGQTWDKVNGEIFEMVKKYSN